jgi:hypothetical protein
MKVTDPSVLAQLESVVAPETQRALQDREYAQQAWADASPLEQFGVGVAKLPVQLYMGAKQGLGKVGIGEGLTEQDKAELRALQEAQSGLATTGEVVGEMATWALPGAGIAAGIPRAAARVGADTLLGTGMEALRERDPDSDMQMEDLIAAAVGTGLGSAGGEYLVKSLRGRGRNLVDKATEQGLPMRLSPGTNRVGMERVEELLEATPIVGNKVQQVAREGYGDFMRYALNKVAKPTGEMIEGTGAKGLKQTRNALKQAYKDLWGTETAGIAKKVRIDPDAFVTDALNMGRYADIMPPEQAAALGKRFEYLNNLTRKEGGVPVNALSDLDDYLRNWAEKATSKVERDAYRELRASLMGALPEGMGKRLRSLDTAYRQYKTLEKAAKSKAARSQGRVATPEQMLGAAAVRDDDTIERLAKEGIEAGLTKDTLKPPRLRRVLGTGAAGGALLADPVTTLTSLAGARALYSDKGLAAARGAGRLAETMDKILGRKGVAASLGYGVATDD